MLFLTDDPALVILYSQLRQMTLQTLRGASKVTPKVEWAFIIHNARLYDRMGCDLLALDLGMSIIFVFASGFANEPLADFTSQFAIGNFSSLRPLYSKTLVGQIHGQCCAGDPRWLL
jgi:hypothetical protein